MNDILNYQLNGSTIVIEDIEYDAEEVFHALLSSVGTFNQFGETLRIGRHVLEPLSNPTVANKEEHPIPPSDIIQKQFNQLFEEISHLKRRLNDYTENIPPKCGSVHQTYQSQQEQMIEEENNPYYEDDNYSDKQTQENYSKTAETNDWSELLRSLAHEPQPEQEVSDVGDRSLKRKWKNNPANNPLHEPIPDDIKYNTEYFTLGVESRNKSSNESTNEFLEEKFSELTEEQTEYEQSSLDNLTEALISKIENNPGSICPQCFRKVPSKAFFCSKCGYKVQKRELQIPDLGMEDN